jgi:glycyl-radical enzyme activating protein
VTQGLVFDIQRFSIHDGPGIRTTVFLKGCPRACLWCHNPESQGARPEIFFTLDRCISCHLCEQICPESQHYFEEQIHFYERDGCLRCGQCTLECYSKALELVGRMMTVEEVMSEVSKDALFYQNSGGGMTLSGGEPMLQFEFTRELFRAAREAGLHTCLETSGLSTSARFAEILPYVDLFLYDIKETDPVRHRQFTGVPNQVILENVMELDRAGANLILRCPIIPGLNDREDHFQGIADLANRLKGVQEIHLLPYHPLGKSKNERLGKISPLGEINMPEEWHVKEWISLIKEHTHVEVAKE